MLGFFLNENKLNRNTSREEEPLKHVGNFRPLNKYKKIHQNKHVLYTNIVLSQRCWQKTFKANHYDVEK